MTNSLILTIILTTEQIRRELRELIGLKKSKCTTLAQKRNATNEAQSEINKKYGKDWRSRESPSICPINAYPSIYDDRQNNEYWMD